MKAIDETKQQLMIRTLRQTSQCTEAHKRKAKETTNA